MGVSLQQIENLYTISPDIRGDRKLINTNSIRPRFHYPGFATLRVTPPLIKGAAHSIAEADGSNLSTLHNSRSLINTLLHLSSHPRQLNSFAHSSLASLLIQHHLNKYKQWRLRQQHTRSKQGHRSPQAAMKNPKRSLRHSSQV